MIPSLTDGGTQRCVLSRPRSVEHTEAGCPKVRVECQYATGAARPVKRAAAASVRNEDLGARADALFFSEYVLVSHAFRWHLRNVLAARGCML
jgi:hypothetical protein